MDLARTGDGRLGDDAGYDGELWVELCDPGSGNAEGRKVPLELDPSPELSFPADDPRGE